MEHKSQRVAALVAAFGGQETDARYLAFFDCFNRQLFYEAHDVLEALWLEDRAGADGAFYKGLIQIAGAFVHLQKSRPGPAAALLKLARGNLEKYPSVHARLDVAAVLALTQDWLQRLESSPGAVPPLSAETAPRVRLRDTGKAG